MPMTMYYVLCAEGRREMRREEEEDEAGRRKDTQGDAHSKRGPNTTGGLGTNLQRPPGNPKTQRPKDRQRARKL